MPARSSEREALAAAIAAHRDIRERLERTRAALTKAEEMRFAAFRTHDDAGERLAAARGNDGAWLAARLTSRRRTRCAADPDCATGCGRGGGGPRRRPCGRARARSGGRT